MVPRKASKDPECSICNKIDTSHWSALIEHKVKYVKNMKIKQNFPAVKGAVEKQCQRTFYKETTEIQIAVFIAECNLPFTLAHPLVRLIQALSPTNSLEKIA